MIVKEIAHRFIRDFQTFPPDEQKKHLASVGKAVVTCTLEPALKAGDQTVAPLAAFLNERRHELTVHLGHTTGYEARSQSEFRNHTFTQMKDEQAAARRSYYHARRGSAGQSRRALSYVRESLLRE